MAEARLELNRAAELTPEDLMNLAGRHAGRIKDLGPNPMKGGTN